MKSNLVLLEKMTEAQRRERERLKKEYDDVVHLGGEYFAVKHGQQWGCVANGHLICDVQYDKISYFEEGFAIVRLGSKFGFINRAGVPICLPEYDFVYFFTDGYAVVAKSRMFGAINEEGKVICPLRYASSCEVDQVMREQSLVM